MVQLILLFLGLACEKENANFKYHPPEVGFYHWQQQLQLDSLPRDLLDNQVPLYTRFFDVTWSNSQAAAVSLVRFDSSQINKALIPVVFLTNEVMKFSTDVQRKELAKDIINLVDTLYLDYRSSQVKGGHPRLSRDSKAGVTPASSYASLQIDCDWTISTRVAYFSFLEQLQAQLPPEVELSVTVRLHQYRDSKQQGIPPVGRATLMAYNVGDLDTWATENSILDSNITAAYLRRPPESPYPIKLDLALPFYNWGAIYREDKLVYLVNELGTKALIDSSRFRQLATNRFRVVRSTYLDGYYLYEGDLIRLEGPEMASLSAVRSQLNSVPNFTGQRLLFYRIGSRASAEKKLIFFSGLGQSDSEMQTNY